MKTYSEIYARVATLDMVEDDGRIWMSLLNRNGICEFDKQTGHAKIVKIFEGEELYKERLYLCVKKVGRYLVFAPGLAKKIAIYDTVQGFLSYIPLRVAGDNCRQDQREIKFHNMFQHGTDVYLQGYSYPAIVRINIKTMETTYITDWVEEVDADIQKGDLDGYFSHGYIVDGDYVLFPMGCISAILQLDLKTADTKVIKLKTSMKGIGGMFSPDGNCVWMVGRGRGTNRVACWNRRTGQIKEFEADGVEDIQESQSQMFYEPICVGDKMLLLPFSAACNSIYEICADTGEIKKSGIMENSLKDTGIELWPWHRIMAPVVNGDLLAFITCDDFCWHVYNVATGESHHYYVLLDNEKQQEEYFHSFFSNRKEFNGLLWERWISLQHFIGEVSRMNEHDEYEKENKDAVGGSIYAQLSEK